MPAQEQTELTCVSCDTTFDPAPNGGFCPDCDTPHPDYEMQAADDAGDANDGDDDATADAGAADDDGDDGDDAECGSCGSTVDASAAFCPECGSEIGAEEAADDAEDEEAADDSLDACPDCDAAVGDEVYCPSCGTHLEPIRAGEDADDASADASEEVTLVIGGESYTFGDGDSFGRQDADWLQNLVTAAGGSESATYVSGTHLDFSVEDDGVYVTDVSTNGTALNGTEMDGGTERLADGDTLTLAERAEIDVQL